MNDRLRDLGGRLFGGRPAPQSGTDEQDEAAAPGRRVAMARLAGVGAVALAAGSLAPLGAQEPDPDPSMGGVVDARGFGAVGDGEADDTAAIQAALDAAATRDGVAFLPTGTYRLSASLAVPPHTTLLGEGVRWENPSTRLIVPEPGFSAVVLSHLSCVKGLSILYPNNLDNSAPIEYPPAVELTGINPSVEDVVFGGAWVGVSTPPGAAANTGQALLRNLSGFVHSVGVHLDGPLDIVRIENVHWFVGGDGSKGDWYRDNRVGFEFGRVDGVMMSRCFMIGGRTFVHQLARAEASGAAPAGPAHSLTLMFSQCWVENVPFGFLFDAACGVSISDCQILVNDPAGYGIRLSAGSVYYGAFVNNVQVRCMPGVTTTGLYCSFSEPHPRNHLCVTNLQVVDGAPAVHLGPGAARVSITNSHLMGAGAPAVLIEEGADLIQITGNVIAGEEPIRDESLPDARKIITNNLLES